MKKIKVNLKKRSYDILIGKGTLSSLKAVLKELKLGKVAIVVTNRTIYRLYGPLLKRRFKGSGLEVHFELLADSERSKSAKGCIHLIERFANLDQGKGIFVVAFGGGVIGDLAGFTHLLTVFFCGASGYFLIEFLGTLEMVFLLT